MAPGNHGANTSPVTPDGNAITRSEIEAASTTGIGGATTATDDAAAELQNSSPELPPSDPKKPTSLERARTALAESNATALSDNELCTTLVEVARNNDLPLGFFANLIWRESRFDHDAISPVGAMGIAQFMPDVAQKLSLDAFDSRSALPASGRLLRTLRARFGNLGLAAAAYNAGPKRVSDWLDGRSTLPRETQDYIHLITGQPAARWHTVKPQTVVFRVPRQIPCHRSTSFAFAEQLERTQQERMVAEESRVLEQQRREAAARRLAELKHKSKNVARSARLQIAARIQTAKSVAAPRQAKVRVAQLKR